jgi:hypothetical protein
MLPFLLLLVATQLPAVPGEGTLVSFCKQGRLTACEQLKALYPQKYAEVQAELAKAALRQEALRAAEESQEKAAAESSEAEASGASQEPPNCKGQEHHIISRPIAEALSKHETLAGLYEPRDERLKTRAKDMEAHCGYQDWHRKVDKEVIDWLNRNRTATREQFMNKLREIYKRPDMLKRFPHGF